MFCPKCGKSLEKGLKYCNGCGKRLGNEPEDKDGTPGKMLDNVLTTIFLIVMFGLGILVGLVAVLLGNDVRTEVVTTIVIAYLSAVFGICFLLVRQVPKLIDAKLRILGHQPEQGAVFAEPAQLRPVTTSQLEEFRQPIGSVTDSTTRTLEKVPLRRD